MLVHGVQLCDTGDPVKEASAKVSSALKDSASFRAIFHWEPDNIK